MLISKVDTSFIRKKTKSNSIKCFKQGSNNVIKIL